MQVCCTCNVSKDVSCFHKQKSRACGISKVCKECKKISDAKYRESHIEKIREKDRQYYKANADSVKERAKQWYVDNPERAKEQRKLWHDSNKETVDANRKKWIEEHSDEYNEYMKKYQRERYRNNIDYKIKTLLNARIRSCLIKSKPTLDFIGCDFIQFREWIEFQFDEHMNWSNIGTYWHIDHVKPCASFDFQNDEDIKECFKWSNLRPLEKRENSSKGSKVIPTLIYEHEQKVIQFLNKNLM